MTKYHKRHRIIATFFLLIFFPTLLPNNLFASNNGPKSPEASSFEPVDATDMVNLITGQYSYVLPLLNVPSPEGGYPLAMGYHAGIALDQEASWTGLGWNVNPGAIDRNINGYPDDYNAATLNEYFWDRTHTETRYAASVSWSGYGMVSVGVGFNWGSNQALGGYVGVGVGMDVGGTTVGVTARAGTDGGSLGVGITSAGGLSVGANINTNGDVGVSAGYSNINKEGFSVGYNTNGTVTASYDNNGEGFSVGQNKNGTTSIGVSGKMGSMDISFSTNGVGISADAGGTGMSLSFNNSVSIGDYSTSSSGWMIPIVVPTYVGVFSASFGKQEFKYWMGKNVVNYVTSPLYFHKGVADVTTQVYVPRRPGKPPGEPVWIPGYWKTVYVEQAFMDINEVSINDGNFSNTTDVAGNNMTFPNYDDFAVSGQGVSGSMSATIYKNGALFGLNGKENKDGYSLKYTVRNENASSNSYTKFNSKPQFDFDNEITTYLNVEPATFNNLASNTNALNYYNAGSTDINDKPRRKTSTFIEYYTNEEIIDSYATLKANGFLQPSVSGFDRSVMPKNGIGAFKVTTIDGKTYHYSLPVYNHEIITRTFGIIPDSPDQSQSYFEKRQLEPFATHWVLTAVTGPDYVDNGDGVAGEGDLGYWTSFEYGKWTDAFIWKAPYKKETLTDDKDPTIQTWVRGRKELYYLDKVKTRTHTALFVKGTRQDAPSPQWNYNSADHINDKQNNAVVNDRFIVPSQNQLRLEKIILLKNTDITVDKTYGTDANESIQIKYNQSTVKEDLEAKYNIYDNILDNGDNWSANIGKALKVIDFNYDYSLVPGDNRLTLKSVDFKGKSGASVLPPYKFDYINDTSTFNIDNKDGWGYLADKPETFSLNKITTPQGGTIAINYENAKYRSIIPSKLDFSNKNPVKYKCSEPSGKKVILSIGNNESYPIALGKSVDVYYYLNQASFGPFDILIQSSYIGKGTITQLPSSLGAGQYEVTFDGEITTSTIRRPGKVPPATPDYRYVTATVSLNLDSNSVFTGSSPRVASLKVSDGVNNYITDYKYGVNEDGIGYVPYVPYSQNTSKEIPYSAELPAPRVMYEYVTMSSHKEGVEALSKMRYRFNIMKEKSLDKVKFGSFYEIVKTTGTPFVNSSNKEVSTNSYTVKENFASLGQLLEVVTVNSKNQLLSKVYTTYYNLDEIPNNIGVTKESYQSYKEVDYINNASVKDKWIINSSTRIKYPRIVKSSTEQTNGYTYTTLFNDYDLISGISKEQVYKSSDGQSFRKRVIPAYAKYPEMGSKVDNINNKHMLSQIAVNSSSIQENGVWKETGVGITTWSNLWSYRDAAGTVTIPSNPNEKVWRKHKAYTWNGTKDNNGIFLNYSNTNEDNFNWTLPPAVGVNVSQPSQWKQISEITAYDRYSSALELKGINNNYASTKMGDNGTKIIAVGNARYNEIFYTGAENASLINFPTYLEPEISFENTSKSASSHTGKFSIAATSNSKFGVVLKNSEHKAGKYKVSVWVEKTNAGKAKINSISNNNTTQIDFKESYTAGNWVLKTGYVDVIDGQHSIYIVSSDSSTIFVDDLMIRPVSSTITGYVYNEWDELTHIIGNNGLATRFEYDKGGRLIRTYSEVIDDIPNGVTGGFKLVKSNTYNNKYF